MISPHQQLRSLIESAHDIGNITSQDSEELHKFINTKPELTIEYHTKQVYGNNMDYIKDPRIKTLVMQLTGQKTINSVTREILRELTGGYISWRQVIQ